MTGIKRNVIVEEVVYEITEGELKRIREAAREQGRCDVLSYLRYLFKHYSGNFGLVNQINILNDIMRFVLGTECLTKNRPVRSFRDYIKECSFDENLD